MTTIKRNKTKEKETYEYFTKKFGKITCIDEALTKIKNKGYGSYYNGRYTNKQSIDRIKNKQGINCTDSTQLIANLALHLGYTDVKCIHVQCKSGGGHVRLSMKSPKTGNTIYRDPATVLSTNSKTIKDQWCTNGKLIDTNPKWWTDELYK